MLNNVTRVARRLALEDLTDADRSGCAGAVSTFGQELAAGSGRDGFVNGSRRAIELDVRKAALLLDYGADIDAVDDEFRSTPLGLAARWGRQSLVRLLLDRGADRQRAAAEWATPLAWAQGKGHTAVAALLR